MADILSGKKVWQCPKCLHKMNDYKLIEMFNEWCPTKFCVIYVKNYVSLAKGE